jgi:hypothetical protein
LAGSGVGGSFPCSSTKRQKREPPLHRVDPFGCAACSFDKREQPFEKVSFLQEAAIPARNFISALSWPIPQ